jgi:hypothetical protein
LRRLTERTPRKCLGSRRIPDLKTVRSETRAWNRRLNRDKVSINWTFDRRSARRKFGYTRNVSKRSKTQAGADGKLAASLNNTARSTEAFGFEVRMPRMFAIPMQILKALARASS